MASFAVICFADLKKYKFTYLFAFPALHSELAWKLIPNIEEGNASEEITRSEEDLITHMLGTETAALVDAVHTWRYRVDSRQHGFFLAKKERVDGFAMSSRTGEEEELSQRPITPGTPGEKLGFTWSIGSLMDYEQGFFDGTPSEDRYVCFTDPSTYLKYPGWMLRNLLVLIRRRWKLNEVQILCYRDVHSHRDDAKSIILSLKLEGSTPSTASGTDASTSPEMPKVTGWERNSAGKVVSRVANLGEYMDPQRYLDELRGALSITNYLHQAG